MIYSLLLGLVIGFAGYLNVYAPAATPLQGDAVRVFTPSQGGTGIGSATAGDVGKCLTVSTSAPFVYAFAACSGGSSSSFSTTSANHWATFGLAFSTTSADYWETQQAPRGGGSSSFATTSANYWSSVGLGFSTTSTAYFSSLGLAFSTTSADAWGATKNYLTTVDISANTNLAVTAPIILTNDTLSIDTAGTWTGLAGTATALAANGANCNVGSYSRGVDASGAAENCTADADTTYTAGDHLTLTGTDFDVDDDFILNTGDIGTGSYTFPDLLSTNSTSTNATSTSLNVSGQIDFDTLTSALILTGAGGILAEYAGTSCTNQFVRSLSALGAATCATVANTDLANSSLTVNGTSISLGSSGTITAASSTLLADLNTFSGQTVFSSNVGIGTTTPQGSLAVQGAATTHGTLTVVSGSGASTALSFGVYGDTSPQNLTLGVTRGGNVGVGQSPSATARLAITSPLNSDGMFISTSGAVQALNVTNTTAGGLFRYTNGNGSWWDIQNNMDNTLTFDRNDAAATLILSSGNVGIGTTSPLSSLTLCASCTFALPYDASFTPGRIAEIGVDTTSNQIKYYSGGAARVLGNGNQYPAFTYASSTAMVGTTTLPLGVAMVGETWNSVSCFTDVGTIWVAFDDGTNITNYFQASTTVGVVTLSTNNAFASSEKRYVKFGNPASSPTKLSCTVNKSITAD